MARILHLDHFWNAIFGRGQALTLLRNSIVTVGGAVRSALAVSTLGGYALSRGTFPFKRALTFGVLLVQIIPGTATVLPLYLIMRELGLVNTLFGVTLGMTTGAIPFMLWVMKGFIDTVPLELEEAAFLDGATRVASVDESRSAADLARACRRRHSGLQWRLGSLFPAPDPAIRCRQVSHAARAVQGIDRLHEPSTMAC